MVILNRACGSVAPQTPSSKAIRSLQAAWAKWSSPADPLASKVEMPAGVLEVLLDRF